jgi:hypothetical protein
MTTIYQERFINLIESSIHDSQLNQLAVMIDKELLYFLTLNPDDIEDDTLFICNNGITDDIYVFNKEDNQVIEVENGREFHLIERNGDLFHIMILNPISIQ